MDELTKFLVKELIDGQSVTAIYGGGFKPPTKGHFDLVKTALKDFKDIDKFLIYVGSGIRDGIEQEQALQIWGIYKELLPSKVQIEPSATPIGDVMRYAKNHPEEKVYFIIGYREGREDDIQDIKDRTKGVEEKYPNLEVRVIKTPSGDMSGTNARKALKKGDKEEFFTYLPTEVPDNEKEDIYNILEPTVFKENVAPNHDGKSAPFGSEYKPLKENTIPSIDILEKIAELTNYMRGKGYNIDPAPSIELVGDDMVNAGKFLGKTAYYDPINKSITIYTYGRHPKDIVRSYAHEMIHHIQNLEDRLGDVSTTNTLEDDHINDLEKEANLKGTMTFRNWTDSIKEDGQKTSDKNMDGYKKQNNPSGKVKDPFGLNETSGADTAWTGADNETITLQDILELTKNIKIVNLPTKELATIVLNWDDNPEEIERISQVEISSQYPILIMVDDQNKIQWILDGNHRAQKALRAKSETIPAKLIKPSNLDSKARKVLLGIVDEGKNKDPFGLNQYARELAQGLEEIITDTEIICDNCGWEWKIADGGDDLYICHKCGHDNTPSLLTEGRYDKFTNELSSFAFELMKDGSDVGKKVVDELFVVGPADEEVDIVSDEFEFDFVVQAIYTDDTYKVGGGANAGFDDKKKRIQPLLTVRFEIPKDIDWQTVSFDLKDVIRHELEHLTQDGENLKGGTDSDDPRLVRPSKYMEDDEFIRNLIDVDLLPKSDYFKLEKEIDAMLQGLYFKAKKSRKPYLEVIDDYLDKQPVNPQERKDILNLWAKRAKALSLPFNQSIQEVGEGSAKAYDWELLQTNPGDYTYGFTTDSGVEYEVNLVALNYEDDETGEFINGLEIRFSAGEKGEDKSDIEVINKGEVFRVMATIVEIIQFAIKLVPDFKPTNAIIYNPARKKGEGATGNQRDKLYQAYIKKAIPNITFLKDGIAIIGKFDSLKESSYLYDTGVKKMDKEMGEKKYVIFCDMDGVLVDFDKGYKDLTGLSTKQADSQGRNEFWKLFGKSLKEKNISDKSYWASLDWMPDGKQLWSYISPYNPYVLTAPSVNFDIPFEDRYKLENNESMQGKTEWVQRLPNMRKLYFRSAGRKADFADPNKILIDDRKDTIDSWNANGGIGILHTSTANTIKQLQAILDTNSSLNEIFEKDLPIVNKVRNGLYIVSNGKGIEAKYDFRLQIPEKGAWSMNWIFTPNNTDKSPEAWKQVTATSFKVLEDFLKNNKPTSISISGNTEGKTNIYKNYINKLETLLNNRYRIDNSDEYSVVLRSIEDIAESSIRKRMETLNESYEQSLNYFQNGDLYSPSKIERWNSFKKKIQRTLLRDLYKL